MKCVYGSPACVHAEFKGITGARQHWSCLPGTVFSAVITGLGRSMPQLRDHDRVVLASVAAWAAFGATPSLAAAIASELSLGHTAALVRPALREALETTLGADMPAEVEAAGSALLAYATGIETGSPQATVVLGVTELQLRPVTGVPAELRGDPTGRTYVTRELGSLAQEAFWVVPIDAATQVRSVVRVGIGEYHSVGAPIPAVLTAVLRAGTDVFWVAHNHPSGDVAPSKADVQLTETLSVAAREVNLHLVDHVIVGPHGANASLAECGLYEEDWGDLAGEGHRSA